MNSSPFKKVKLGGLFKTANDKSKQLNSSEYLNYGTLPIIDQGQEKVCGYTNDLEKKYDKHDQVVIFGDHTCHVKFIDFPFALGADGTQVLIPNDGTNIKYLYYLILRAANKIGSHGYGRHLKVVKDFDSEFIQDKNQQKKIAEILTSVDKVIELTEIEIEKLKNLKKGMMHDLLTKGIGHTKFKDSPIGKIPDSWEVLTIKDVVEFVTYGFTNPMPTTEIGPFMVTATNVNDGRITYENCRRTSQEDYDTKLSNKSKPIINDILLTKDGTLGRVAIVDREGICINQSVALLRTKDSESSLFLKYLLESPYYQDVMINNAGGSTIKHIYITTLDKMHIVWPGVKERVQISNAIDSINKRIKITEQKLTNLTSLKKGLMQDLLTGKVRVKV